MVGHPCYKSHNFAAIGTALQKYNTVYIRLWTALELQCNDVQSCTKKAPPVGEGTEKDAL